MKFQKQIGPFLITANCAQQFSKQAEALLKKLAELNEKGPALRDGTVIRFGWSDLKLIQHDEELVVYEPDFSKNPFEDYVADVTSTIQVLVEQTNLLHHIHIEGIACIYSDRIILAKGALDVEEIYLQRSASTPKNNSGWYIGKTRDDNKKEKEIQDYESRYGFEVFQIRPSLMKCLVLPVGFLVLMNGNRIESIVDVDNNNVLNPIS